MNDKPRKLLVEIPAGVDEDAVKSAMASINATFTDSVIVDTSFGGLKLYPATVEQARALIESIKSYIPKDVIQLVENNTNIVSDQRVFDLINRILTSPVGTSMGRYITTSQEMINEIRAYAFDKNLDVVSGKLSNKSQFFKMTPDITVFSFLKEHPAFNNHMVVDDYLCKVYDAYYSIYHNNWPESANTARIINNHLDFYLMLSSREASIEQHYLR